jgi:protein-tyrosine phosphatase
MEPDERAGMGLGALDQWVADAGMVFLEAPIDDFSSPDPAFLANWDALRDKLLAKLEAGEKVFLHCRAGLGRSGTITAALLVAGGLRPDDAIHAVRAVRLGAIETPGQVAWLRSLAP